MGFISSAAAAPEEHCLHIEIDGQRVQLDPAGLERASRNRGDLGAKIAEAVRSGYGVPAEE
jgi:hypothetical protein